MVKPSFILMLGLFFGLFTISQVAEAKRFGGGKSFGYSKSVPSKSFNKSAQTTPKDTSKQGAASTGSKSRAGMMGVLGGLAAGGLLAALFMGDGFEGIQILDILLLVLLAFVLFKLFRYFMARSQSRQPAYSAPEPSVQYKTPVREEAVSTPIAVDAPVEKVAQPQNAQEQTSIFGSNLMDEVDKDAVMAAKAPEWFQADAFLEGAKTHFVALQKAWDSADLSEIEAYCTPELFRALQQEMVSLKAGNNHTVVDTLDAEIAAMAIEGDYFIVSIRFTGFIKESLDSDAHAFNEVWHIRRLVNNEGLWQVAGIQQNS